MHTAIATKYQRAYERAISERLSIRTHETRPEFAYVSSGRGDGAYLTNGRRCTCKAGQAGLVCKHAALYVVEVMGAEFEPEPTPPAAPTIVTLQTTQCPDCLGKGYREMSTGGRFSDYWTLPCHRCGNTGRVTDQAAA